jgi:hypothetical protein
MKKKTYPTRPLVQVAPNFLSGGLALQEVQNAMDLFTYTYNTRAVARPAQSLGAPSDLALDVLASFSGDIYPNSIKSYTQKQESAMQFLYSQLSDIMNIQTLNPYIPQDKIGQRQLFMQFGENIRNGGKDALNALATVADVETVVSVNAAGKSNSYIYHAAFEHIHSGNTVGKFKNNPIQSFYIGIYNDKERQYLNEIAALVQKNNIERLSEEQKVTYEYISRLGASLSDVTDLVKKEAKDIILTDAPVDEFRNYENLTKGIEALNILGKHQEANAVNGINQGISNLIDNVAEILANKNSLLTGWNSPFDAENMIRLIMQDPRALEELNRRVKELGGDSSIGLQMLYQKTFDPLNDYVYKASAEARSQFMTSIYGSKMREFTNNRHGYQMENIAKALGLDGTHHDALVDIQQERQFFFDMGDKFFNPLDDDIKKRTINRNVVHPALEDNIHFKGIVFQGKSSGSMENIRKYNNDVFAIIRGSNGNIYTSTGFNFDKATGKTVSADQFTPGAWAEGVTYETTGMSIISKDSEIAKRLSSYNSSFIDDDIVKIDYRQAYQDDLTKLSEIGMETRSIFMPKSRFANFGNYVNITGYIDKNTGRYEYTDFGIQVANAYRRSDTNPIKTSAEAHAVFTDINELKGADRTERSFTKYGYKTNSNAIMLQEILDEGTFPKNVGTMHNKTVALQSAIQKSNSQDSALRAQGKAELTAILGSTKNKFSAEEVAKSFLITDKETKIKSFSNGWLTNCINIGRNIQEGSLFKQLHASMIDIITGDEFRESLSTNDNPNIVFNTVYHNTMEAMMEYFQFKKPQQSSSKLYNTSIKRINEYNKFFVNINDFVKRYRPEHYIPSKSEQLHGNWLNIDLDGGPFTISQITRATELNIKTDEQERKVVLDFVNFLTKQNDIVDNDSRELLKDLYQTGSKTKDTVAIALEMQNILKSAKEKSGGKYGGYVPQSIQMLHTSGILNTALGHQMTQEDTEFLRKVIKQEYDSVITHGMNKDKAIEKVRNFMINRVRGGESGLNKALNPLNDNLKAAAMRIYKTHVDGANAFAKTLVSSLADSGISLQISDLNVVAKSGSRRVDLTSLIPKLQSNQIGTMYLSMDPKTKYIGGTMLEFRDPNDLSKGFKLKSVLEESANETFGYQGAYLKAAIKRAQDNGDDVLDVVYRFVKNAPSAVREYSLATGSVAADMVNMTKAKLKPLFSERNLKAIIEYYKSHPTNEKAHKEAIEVLEKYLENPGIEGLHQDEAILKLMSGDNPVINPIISGMEIGDIDLTLEGTAKQSSTEGASVAFAKPFGFFDRYQSYERGIQDAQKNAIYMNTHLTKTQRNRLEEGKVRFDFGSTFATPTEQTINRYTTETGIQYAGSIQQYALEADEKTKEEIVRVLRQKYKDDDTLARVFNMQFKPYEGGGWMNGRLYDTFENPRTWQIIKPGRREILSTSNMDARKYESGMNLRFKKGKNGKVSFMGYGKGIYANQNDPIANFYEQFFGEEREIAAKRKSIASIVYLSEDGKHIVSENDLRDVITKKLNAAGIEMNAKNFMAMADQTYTKAIVAKRIFDSGIFKVADSDKHESVAGIRAIGDYFSGVGTEEWQKDEALLSKVFASDEFSKWSTEVLGEDFRTGHTFTSEIYEDIASMKFSSPIFEGYEDSLKKAIYREYNQYAQDKLGIDIFDPNLKNAQRKPAEKAIRQKFKQSAIEARYRLSDIVNKEFNATFLRMSFGDAKADPFGTVVGHGNKDELIYSAFNYVSNQLHPDKASTTVKEIKEDKQKFIDLVNGLGLFTHRGQKFELTLDEQTGTILSPTEDWNINDITLKEVFGFNGKEIDKNIPLEELKRRQNLAISEFNKQPQWITTYMLSDTYGSLMKHKISDRELMSYTNTLWDENLVNRLVDKAGSEEKFVGIFGKLIDENIKSKEDFTKLYGRPVFDRELDFFFDRFAFMRWSDRNPLSVDKDGIFKKVENPSTYREVKTNELVENLRRSAGSDRIVSQSFADDLYEVASLRKATDFNISRKITEKELMSDSGLIKDEEFKNGHKFFRKVGINDINVAADTSIIDLIDNPNSIYGNNLLIDLKDSRLGLDSSTLNRTSIASAGVSLTPNGQDRVISAEYQKTLSRIQNEYTNIQTLHEQGVAHDSEEYQQAIRRLNKAADVFVQQQNEYSKGMEKSSKALRIQSTRMPGSVTGKVNVFTQGDELLRNKNITNQNIAIISEANLADMGFDDKYFNKLEKKFGITKEDWLKEARTNGIMGRVHRNPSDYWGSTMAVQIYVDPSQKENQIAYDNITAAFLKADSDGDYAKAMMQGTVDKNGNFIDVNTLRMLKNKGKLNDSLLKDLKTIEEGHKLRINIQEMDTNAMVQKVANYNKELDKVYAEYANNIFLKNDTDGAVEKLIRKDASMSLGGKFIGRNTEITNATRRREISNAFSNYKDDIVKALENTKGIDETVVNNIKYSSDGIYMAAELQSYFWNPDSSSNLREEFFKNLGSNAQQIDLAYQDAISTDSGRRLMLNKLSRKGVGLSDTPFMAVDVLRANAVNSGRNVLSNEQNAAMYLLKELEKEQVLTPKKQAGEITENVTKNLDALNTLMNDVFKNGKNNAELKERFINFMEETARKPDSRYAPESLLKIFIDSEGNLDSRKIWGKAYEGIVNSVEDARQNSPMLRNVILDVSHLSALGKGRRSDVFQHAKTFASYVNNSIAASNGFEDTTEMMARQAELIGREAAENKETFEQLAKQRAITRKAINANVVKGFKSTKSLAIAALGIAGAAVFGGYAGGNPSVPAQQQAQGVHEQNPPPRAINLADKSLTTASRKQAGYVINLNVQTQKDKEYASRLITQAVTQNFQDTNVNVSMNVNQQPGNISGKDLMDYLEQAL